ncbi:unnamed protein product [Phytomonas sp. EM1]|nr:unnamed protein product [Phytomonas sp. EM1]|eukprot:CCW61892.1 unnamed protein product [Phytomonas sp. isolate EM1]
MNKVILTTYRSLLKMCSRADRDLGMRSMLSCAPIQVYNHSINEWVPLNVGKLSSWQDSRIFVDNLIRRLNNIRQFYIPPSLHEETVTAMNLHRLRIAQQKADESIKDSKPVNPKGDEPGMKASSSTSAPGDRPASESTSKGFENSSNAVITRVPLDVKPYDLLCPTLRFFFETTPFSANHLANAFAAVKELSYLCKIADQHKDSIVGVPVELQNIDRPVVQRILELQPMHHLHLIKGLTDELRQSLMSRGARYAHKIEARRKEARGKVGRGSDEEVDVSHSESGDIGSDTEESVELTSEGGAAETTESKQAEEASIDPASSIHLEEAEGAVEEDTADDNDVDNDESDQAASSVPTTPKTVQLLLAHPQLCGFFRHSVMLVVRHASNESAAFVLNKPLENDEGTQVPVGATVRFSRVHKIFEKYFRMHTIMVGGPVMMGTFEDNLFLLHSIPGIPNALPIADDLWLNGDFDVLMEKLDANEVSPKSVVIMCGFSGWGADQLRGEIESGTWIVASASPNDSRTSNMVLSVSRHSGAHALCEADGDKVPKKDSETETSDEQKVLNSLGGGSSGNPFRARTKFQGTESWVWMYDSLGEPLSGLTRNQKPEAVESPDRE